VAHITSVGDLLKAPACLGDLRDVSLGIHLGENHQRDGIINVK
jgi:hypothetical protein